MKYADRSKMSGLWRTVISSTVLCKPVYCGKCSAELFHAETEGGISGYTSTCHQKPVQVQDEKLMFNILRASFNPEKEDTGGQV